MDCAEIIKRLSDQRGRDWSEREIRQILDCLKPIMQRAVSAWSNLPRAEVEDCQVDAFIDLWNRYNPEKRGQGDLKTWYAMLLRQRLSAAWTTRDHLASLDEMQTEGHEALAKANVEETVLSELVVRTCLDKLPANHREIFELRFVRGLDHKEIATELGISADNSKKRLERAKLALCQIWVEEGILR